MSRPTVEPPARVGAGVLACVLVLVLAGASFAAVFFLAYSGEGEGTSGPDGTAVVLSVIAVAACVGLTIAIAWLGRVAVTGNATRPSLRWCMAAPVVYVLLIASIFVTR